MIQVSDAECALFRHNGFLKFENVFDDETLLAARAELSEAMDSVAESTGSPRAKLYGIYQRSRAARALAEDPRLLGILRGLLGPNIRLVLNRHNHVSINDRQSAEPRLHRDILHWSRFQGDAMSEAFWTDPIDTAAVVSAPGATARSAVVPSNYRTEVEDDGVFVENQYIPGRSYSGCQQSNTGEQSVRSTTIGTTYPFGNSTARMTVSSSQGANYGVAAAESGSSVGFTLAGSLYSRSAWGFDWTFDTRDRSYRKGIEYTKFAITCGVPGNSYTEYKWKPTGETGGVDQNFDIARPTWNNCAGIHAEGIWRRDSDSGYSYKYGAAVKFASVIGIDLSVDRQYSAAQKIEYNVVGLNKKMCGNNANPSIAGKVMMRRQ